MIVEIRRASCDPVEGWFEKMCTFTNRREIDPNITLDVLQATGHHEAFCLQGSNHRIVGRFLMCEVEHSVWCIEVDDLESLIEKYHACLIRSSVYSGVDYSVVIVDDYLE